jgi:hypothetical protein
MASGLEKALDWAPTRICLQWHRIQSHTAMLMPRTTHSQRYVSPCVLQYSNCCCRVVSNHAVACDSSGNIASLQVRAGHQAFPAAVRVGINASLIIEQLSLLVKMQMPANGYLVEAGGGYETAGTSIAVNEMLLQSWEGFLRLFPVFPRGQPASFTGLRAVGAFVVNATLAVNGQVSEVEVLSDAGLNCTFFAPGGLKVAKAGYYETTIVPTRPVSIGGTAGLWQFETEKGARYLIDIGVNGSTSANEV